MEEQEKGHVGRVLGPTLFSRTVITTAFRMTYPFLPVISRGLGVSFKTSGLLVMTRSLAGLSGIAFGPLGERIGYRATMVLGLILFGLGASLVGWFPAFGMAVVGFALIGMAKAAYDPAVRAYLSARVPYDRRGRILGIAEFSWAGGWLLGVPLCGFMISRFGWQSPWMLMAVLVLPSLLLTLRLPGDSDSTGAVVPTRHWGAMISFAKTPRVLPAWGMSFLIGFGHEQFIVVYGAWMEHTFGLGPLALGGLSVVIGFSDLAGEIGVTLLTDRLGKGRSLVTGIAAASVIYLAVPFLHGSLPMTLLALAFLFFAFEFAIVTNLVLLSELVPQRRNTLMASLYAAATLGYTVGALSGPLLWTGRENLLLHGVVSALSMAGVFLVGVLFVFDGEIPSLERAFRRRKTKGHRECQQ